MIGYIILFLVFAIIYSIYRYLNFISKLKIKVNNYITENTPNFSLKKIYLSSYEDGTIYAAPYSINAYFYQNYMIFVSISDNSIPEIWSFSSAKSKFSFIAAKASVESISFNNIKQEIIITGRINTFKIFTEKTRKKIKINDRDDYCKIERFYENK